MPYRFSFRRYQLPLRTPLRTAHGPWGEREGLILRLEDEDGRVGYGEVAPIPWFGTETLAEAVEVCGMFGDKVGDGLLDQVPERFGCVRFALAAARSAIGRGRRPQAVRGGEAGKAGLGGHVPAGQVRLPMTALLPAGSAAVGVMQDRLESGWLSFKWKVGVEPMDRELGLLDELLAAMPGHGKLRLDANGAWDRRGADRWLARCAERPVEFVEQPVEPADTDTLLGLAQDYPVKLALDESVVRLEEARSWQGLGWPGIFVIKPALAGPLGELVAWVDQTKPDVVLSSAIETALGRAAIFEHVLAHPTLTTRALGFGVGELFGDRLWDGPFVGPLLDESWGAGVEAEEIWEEAGKAGKEGKAGKARV